MMTPVSQTGWRPAWFWAVVTAAFLALLYLFQPILLPFVAGMLLAYLLNPPVNRLTRFGIGRGWATLVVLLVFTIIFIGVMLLIVPMLQGQITDLIARLPDLVNALRSRLQGVISMLQARFSAQELQQIKEAVGGQAGDVVKMVGGLLAGIWTQSLALFNVVSLIFITPLVAFYLLRDWPSIVASVDSALPKRHAPTIRRLAAEMDHLLAAYIRGVSVVCIVLAVFYGTALSLAGLQFGLVVGLLSGLMSFVPFIGAIFGFIISVGLALVQFDEFGRVALVAGIFVLGQAMEGNILQPLLVGRQVNLHPVWVMFALLAGGVVFGFVGVLLGVPTAVVLAVLIRFGLDRYRQSPIYLGSNGGGPPAAS